MLWANSYAQGAKGCGYLLVLVLPDAEALGCRETWSECSAAERCICSEDI